MPPSPHPAAERRPPALTAADTPPAVKLLEAQLADCDDQVETAADGDEALRKARAWHPDLILLDIMMPKISGFEVCKRLQADAATRDIAVLMITALDQPSDADRGV